ncbi:MAG TPA: hypothetical protein VMB78_08465 [Dissulfurispiraceae bacterium]|nr:hypothetical protein [Dissulfurispiraceae bacterium]
MNKCAICKKNNWYDSTKRCTYCGGTAFIGWRKCPHCSSGRVPVSKPCPICNPKGDLKNRQIIIR